MILILTWFFLYFCFVLPFKQRAFDAYLPAWITHGSGHGISNCLLVTRQILLWYRAWRKIPIFTRSLAYSDFHFIIYCMRFVCILCSQGGIWEPYTRSPLLASQWIWTRHSVCFHQMLLQRWKTQYIARKWNTQRKWCVKFDKKNNFIKTC